MTRRETWILSAVIFVVVYVVASITFFHLTGASH